MYSYVLKEKLCEELTAHLQHTATKNANVYIDDIPASKFKGQELNVFPFVVIEVTEGKIPIKSNSDVSNTRTVLMNLGVDTSKENNPDVETLASNIIDYILRKQIIGDMFVLSGESIDVAYGKLENEGLSPFKYGAITMQFDLPHIQNTNEIQNLMT